MYLTSGRFLASILSLLFLFLAGCAADTALRQTAPVEQETFTITAPRDRKLIAILVFENKSTYASDKLWDTSARLLFTSILEQGYFRVVEWEKMKQLFDWDTLATANLVKNPEKRGEARKILLCEYFVTGAVTFFDVSQAAEVSAMSKRKTFQTTIRVDLLLQDARTGEYLSAAAGEATERQEFSGGLTGGQTGTWDPRSADVALNRAIRQALHRLTLSYSRTVGGVQ